MDIRRLIRKPPEYLGTRQWSLLLFLLPFVVGWRSIFASTNDEMLLRSEESKDAEKIGIGERLNEAMLIEMSDLTSL